MVYLTFCRYALMLLLAPVYSWIPKNVYQHRFSTALFGDMQIRIHGTKNAYTTLRPYDCVLYLMDNVIDEKDRSLGVYTPTNEIVPLCNREEYSTDFYIDKFRQPYSATKLNSEGRILRVVSADRRGSDCFIVEEYLDTDVFIPLRDPTVNPPPPSPPQEVVVAAATAATVSSNVPTSIASTAVESESIPSPSSPPLSSSFPSSLSTLELFHAIDIANAKLEASLLRIELAQLLAEKTRRSGETTTTTPTSPTQPNAYSSSSSASFVETPLTTTMSPKIGSSPLIAVTTDKAPPAVGPYSQAIISNGFVFVSGCVSLDMTTGRIAEGGVSSEVRCALENLKNILFQAGVTDLSQVCKTTLMIREMSYFPEVNRVYGEYFKGNVKPARSTFEVSFLPMGAFIEIDAIAALPSQTS